jgi:hypothetical protein
LVRADKELRAKGVDRDAVEKRRSYYATLLASVEAVGRSLAPDIDWSAIKSKVALLEDYRTVRGELRIAILRHLKHAPEPLSVNALHEQLIGAMGLVFITKKEQAKHRAILVEALHDLRRGPPALVATTQTGQFGRFHQPEQRWFLKRLRPLAE